MGIYAWVSGNKATEGPAAGETKSCRMPASETVGFGCQLGSSCVCIWELVCAEAQSRRRSWLWPQGLICSGASNWKDWHSGAAVEQPTAMSDPSCWRHPHWTCVYVYFSVMNLQPDQTYMFVCACCVYWVYMLSLTTGWTCSTLTSTRPPDRKPLRISSSLFALEKSLHFAAWFDQK